MAVGLRGFIQGQKVNRNATFAWPGGWAVGDLVLAHCGGQYSGLGPQGSGWESCGSKSWWKVLTTADLAGSLVVVASHVKIQAFTGASRIGRTSSQPSLTVSQAGSGLWVDASRSAPSMAASTYRLGTEWSDEEDWYEGSYFVPVASAGRASLAVASDTYAWSYELVPTGVPGAPTLLQPAAGAFADAAGPVGFGWEHQSLSPQTARKVRITTGSTDRWLLADGTVTTTDTAVTTASTTASVNAGQLAAGAHTWTVATNDGAGFGAYAPARTLTLVAAPAVSSITVTAPAEDLTPSVAWAGTAGYGTLEAHQVLIAPAGDADPTVSPRWDSGVRTGTASPAQVPVREWVNGESLRAWVRVWQTGGVSKLVADDVAFAVTWTPPAAPTVTATLGAPTTVTVSGVVAGRPITVDMSTDAGATWQTMTTRTAAGTSLTVDAPLAAGPTMFRARQAVVIDGVPMASAWGVSASVDAVAVCCLVDDTDRASWLPVRYRSDDTHGIEQDISVSHGHRADGARVDYSPPAGEYGSGVLRTRTVAERQALVAWLLARTVFWLVLPPDDGEPIAPVRVSRSSKVEWDRLAQTNLLAHRNLPLSWVEAS